MSEAQPNVEIQVGRSKMQAMARPIQTGDPDYERLWRLVNENNHERYDGYQRKRSSPIPLVVIEPVAALPR